MWPARNLSVTIKSFINTSEWSKMLSQNSTQPHKTPVKEMKDVPCKSQHGWERFTWMSVVRLAFICWRESQDFQETQNVLKSAIYTQKHLQLGLRDNRVSIKWEPHESTCRKSLKPGTCIFSVTGTGPEDLFSLGYDEVTTIEETDSHDLISMTRGWTLSYCYNEKAIWQDLK